MYIFLALLFIIVLIGIAYLIIRNVLLPMDPSSAQKGLIAGAILVPLLATVLLLFCLFLPKKADKMIAGAMVQVESLYNTSDPEASNQVLDKTQLVQLTKNAHSVRTYLDKNQEANRLVQIIGARVYVNSIEQFACHMDTHLAQFEAKGEPFTLHNILSYTQEQAQTGFRVIARTVEIIVFVLALLLYGAIWGTYYMFKKGLVQSSAVTFGSGAV